MDIRVLQYFLAVVREESITAAAESLHMTQPPLSRQLKDLEEELGKQLFVRSNRRITLTEEGMILRQRAEEIVELLEKTRAEITAPDDVISGDIYIGGAETEAVRFIGSIIRDVQREYPLIRFHFNSGHAEEIGERLDEGLFDFGVFIEPADLSKYEYIKLPTMDTWGLLMRKDAPLAAHKSIQPADLEGLPLIISNQEMVKNEMSGWMGVTYDKLAVMATYNLLYNASLLVEEGVGYALALDKIINTGPDSPLCFRPLEPRLEVGILIAWKRYRVFTKAASVFIRKMQATLLEA